VPLLTLANTAGGAGAKAPRAAGKGRRRG
jgi:hypothetical protein